MYLYASLTVVAILSLFMIVSIFYLCVFLANRCCYLIFVYALIYLLSMYLYALQTVIAILSLFILVSIFYLCVCFANCCCCLIFVYVWIFLLSLCIPCKLLLLSYFRLCFTPFRIEL